MIRPTERSCPRPRTLLLALAFCALPLAASGLEAQRVIQGEVVAEVDLEPLSGTEVRVQGTEIGTLTDEEGRFTLRGVPEGSVTIVARRIGYSTRTVPVAAGQDRVTIRLSQDYLRLEELVVTGRATRQDRRLVATSAPTLDNSELLESPPQSFDQAVQGKIAGVRIASNSGAPGGGLETRIRGTTTIRAQSSPLYIVDGVFVSNQALQNGQRVVTGAGDPMQDNPVNRVADINPNDIESIQVMKGGAASATYGSKAAGGVVIIETKKGRTGEPRYSVSTRGGIFDLRNKLDLRTFTSAEEAASAFGEAGAREFENSGGRVFDNQQALSDRNALSEEVFASVSGGSVDGVQYYGSGNYKDDEGIMANTGFERASGRVNLTKDVTEGGSINLNILALHTKAERGLNGNGGIMNTMMVTPTFFDLRPNEDGVFPVNVFAGDLANPLQTQEILNVDEDVYRFIGSANFDLVVWSADQDAVRLNGVVGADFFQQNNLIQSPPELFFEPIDGLDGTVVRQEGTNQNVNLGLNSVWEHGGEGFSSTLSLGVQFERRELDTNRNIAENLTGGNLSVDAGTQIQVSDRKELEEDFGFFLQENIVAFDRRFSFSAAARFDQASTNSDNEELFFFPQANASYRFPDIGGFLDEVKLRTAFGQSGNQPQFGQEFTPLNLDRNFQGVPGFEIGRIVAQELEPEIQTEIEGGVDVTAWGGRADLDLTGFFSVTSDLILEQSLPPSTGFTQTFFNGGKLRSVGIEASLGVTPVARKELTWVSRVLFSTNESEITDLPVDPFVAQGFGCTLGCFLIEEGESPSRIVGSAGSELVSLGDASPDFEMSFSNDFRLFENLRFFSLIEWRQGQSVVNLSDLLMDGAGNSADFLPEDGVVDPVTECHPDCSGQERITGFANGFTRGFVQSSSFAKIREMSISYTLPEGALENLFGFFDDVRFTLSGRDLIALTDFRGLDPEVSQFGNQAVGRGIDVGPFPPSRSVWLTIDWTF